MKFLISLFVLSGFLSPAIAAKKIKTIKVNKTNINAQVISYNRVKGKILITSKQTARINAGDIFTYGKYCTLEVSKKTSSRAILLTDLCRKKDLPKVGAKITLNHQAADKFSVKRTKVIRNNKTITRYVRPKRKNKKISTGFRFEFSKPTLEQIVSSTDLSTGITGYLKEGNTTAVSASMGYTQINRQDLGLSSKLTFTHYDSDNQGMRASLSATYGFNEHIYVFVGGNGHKFTRGATELGFGAGYQAGVGVQFNEDFGLEVSKIQINNEGVVGRNETLNNDTEVIYQANGVELSLHYTF